MLTARGISQPVDRQARLFISTRPMDLAVRLVEVSRVSSASIAGSSSHEEAHADLVPTH